MSVLSNIQTIVFVGILLHSFLSTPDEDYPARLQSEDETHCQKFE